MGLKLDPQNPLYGNKRAEAVAGFDSDATVIVSPQKMKNTVTCRASCRRWRPRRLRRGRRSELPVAAAADEVASLDFDPGHRHRKALFPPMLHPQPQSEPEAETGTENRFWSRR